jgi:hypothetical protein
MFVYIVLEITEYGNFIDGVYFKYEDAEEYAKSCCKGCQSWTDHYRISSYLVR